MADDIDRLDLDEDCGRCGQARQCRQVYARLGHAEGPSMVLPVVAAFLAPMVIFIVVLAVAHTLLVRLTSSRPLQTAAGLAAAVVLSCCWVAVFRNRPGKTGKNSACV